MLKKCYQKGVRAVKTYSQHRVLLVSTLLYNELIITAIGYFMSLIHYLALSLHIVKQNKKYMNKKNILVAFAGLAISALVIYSCKKSDNPTKTELIAAKTWKLVTLANQPAEACRVDDRFLFNSNGTTSQLTGVTKCNPNEAAVIGGLWNFNAAQDSIFFSFKGIMTKINKLDNTTLEIQTTVNNVATITTFVPQ